MPELDYALLCDYVRAEHGIAHVIAAGIDTVYVPDVPAGHTIGLLSRVAYTLTGAAGEYYVAAELSRQRSSRALVDRGAAPLCGLYSLSRNRGVRVTSESSPPPTPKHSGAPRVLVLLQRFVAIRIRGLLRREARFGALAQKAAVRAQVLQGPAVVVSGVTNADVNGHVLT